MVDGLPSLLWDGCNVSKAQLQDGLLASQVDGIKVLFESFDARDGSRISKTAILSSATTVQEIKLSGKHQGWFKSGDKLVRSRYVQLLMCPVLRTFDFKFAKIKVRML